MGIFSSSRDSLLERISATKKVKVCGIKFKIKKLDMFDFADGSQVLLQMYQTYEDAREKSKSQPLKNSKIRSAYRDIFMAGVVDPALKRKNDPDDPAIFVDNLFTDPELVENLYWEIVAFTYGKKKIRLGRSLKLI